MTYISIIGVGGLPSTNEIVEHKFYTNILKKLALPK